jgi:hypothetical protein
VWVGGANHAKGVSCLRRMTDPIRKAASTHCDMVHKRFLVFAPQQPYESGCHMNYILSSELRCRFRKVGPLIKEVTEILSSDIGSFGSGDD